MEYSNQDTLLMTQYTHLLHIVLSYSFYVPSNLL